MQGNLPATYRDRDSADLPLVVLAGWYAPMFDRVEAALADAPCRIRRYGDMDDFLAAPEDPLREAAVFYGDGWIPLTRERLESAPRLKAIISPFTGTEGFDEEAATDLGIIVANGQIEENIISMAEATILMILASLYDLPGKERQLRSPAAHAARPAHMLSGKTIGFIGYGGIAHGVTERLAGWGARFLANTPRRRELAGASWVDLDTLLVQSDIICVLAPLNAQTAGLLDERRLAQTRPGSILVVMSRGGIVDEAAAARLAASGHFLRVAFDVFKSEPCPADNPLRSLDNAILTPHSIGHSLELSERLPEAGIEKILTILDGRLPANIRNPDVIPKCRLGIGSRNGAAIDT